MTTEVSRPLPVLSNDGLGPLLEVDKTRMIGYESIRYVPGYPSSYVEAYASAYAMREVAAERDCRTCCHYTPHHRAGVMHCSAPLRCVAGRSYTKTGKVQEWIDE